MFEGNCDRSIFETYLEHVLLKNIPAGSTIIFDNASYHKGGRIAEIIKAAGCYLLYLPPYSPDFNPIEHLWASFKHFIRKTLSSLSNTDIYEAAHLYTCNMTT